MDWLTADILSRWKLTEVALYILENINMFSIINSTDIYRIDSNTVDDAVVIAIAQHCTKLETLTMRSSNIPVP